MARTRKQRGGQNTTDTSGSEETVTLENNSATQDSGAQDSGAFIEPALSVRKKLTNTSTSSTTGNNSSTKFNIPTGLAPNSITTANNNNNTRRQVRSKLMAFQRKLNASQASGATGPVMYDKELLIDQLFILNNTLQPLRAIVREADTLMDMIKLGTSQAIVEKNYNTRNIIQKRIQDKVKNTTKKKGREKKMKLKNIEKLFD
jgi:hypothetical protein